MSYFENTPLEPRTVELILARLERHLGRIASQDWDYFASLRFVNDGAIGVSDIARLRRHLEAREAQARVAVLEEALRRIAVEEENGGWRVGTLAREALGEAGE